MDKKNKTTFSYFKPLSLSDLMQILEVASLLLRRSLIAFTYSSWSKWLIPH